VASSPHILGTVAMPHLKHLVIDVDMTCFMENYDFPKHDLDVHCVGNATLDFEQWPVFRMLSWAHKDLKSFVPQLCEMEIWTNNKRALPDTHPDKFWICKDWIDQSLGFPSTGVTTAVVHILMRHSAEQVVLDLGYDSDS
jgi:hypothetical protein